jgi:hypothetical protein
MSSGITTFCANLLLSKLLLGSTGTFPTTFFCALSTTIPNDGGSGFTEPATGGYSRQPMTVNTTTWAALSAGSTSNLLAINYTTATAAIGTVSDWGLFDATTAGALHLWADLTTPQTIANGNPYSFATGALIVGAV